MIEAILKNITNNRALLELNTGEQITINTSNLPTDTSTGDVLFIEIMSKDAYQKKQNQSAKDILNELLQS